MRRGRLLVISGPSGAGKGTICNKVLENIRYTEFSVSMTTREPRPGEIDGVSYIFTSREKFEEMIENDGFLEYAQIFGNLYGTPKDVVYEKLDKGINIILEIDVQGAMQIKKECNDAVFIFIVPPSMSELQKRITNRGTETEESLKLRLGEATNEISYVEKYDYVVVNDALDEAVLKVESIIRAERAKVREDIYKLMKLYEEEN